MANTPNYAGMFLRGYGSQNHTKNNGSLIGNTNTNHASGNIGVIQGDGVRPITGELGWLISIYAPNSEVHHNWSVLHWAHRSTEYDSGINNYQPQMNVNLRGEYNPEFDNNRVTPTGNEIRPVNIAVRYLIRSR